MARPNKILVAYDGSPHSKQALEWAIDLSRASNGSVVVVFVSEPIHMSSLVLYNIEGGSERLLMETIKEIKEKDRQTLEEAKNHCASHGIEVKAEILEGNIAETIINYAKKEQIDLIVAGTKGHGALEELLMGSVTRNLVSLAHTPVLVVKD